MARSSSGPAVSPPQSDTIPDSYALFVGERWIHVWQYRVDLANPDGDWYYLEALDREREPRLSLEYATPTEPEDDGYWIFSKTYDCQLSCE